MSHVWIAALLLGAPVLAPQGLGYQDTPFLPGGKWRVHDGTRPLPPVVTPPAAQPSPPPPGAIVLFDGKDLSKWDKDWTVADGAFVVTRGKGSIATKDEFGDGHLHIEFATPNPATGSSQGRGNSGVFLMGLYEIQILDSYKNDTYADGQAAALYGQYPPRVNACRPPGEWQSYDIFWKGPRFEGDKLVRPASVTMLHNGVLVHLDQELLGVMAHRELAVYTPHGPKGKLSLQDHGNPVRFRNIWFVPAG